LLPLGGLSLAYVTIQLKHQIRQLAVVEIRNKGSDLVLDDDERDTALEMAIGVDRDRGKPSFVGVDGNAKMAIVLPTSVRSRMQIKLRPARIARRVRSI
jgi:hypothetical protein